MNIWNSSKRDVVCVRNEDNKFFGCDENSPMLEVGKTYTVEEVDVHGWHTEVYLKEIPDVPFNSVLFEEMPQPPKEGE